MSNLWVNAALHQAKPWIDMGRYSPTPKGHPVSVRKAGFASYVDPHDFDDETGESDIDRFDEDLYDQTTPEPTMAEREHDEEHNEYPESYHERHDQAYGEAMDAKKAEDRPDRTSHELGTFIGEHASEASTWHQHGTLGPVDLTQPIHATQSHVHTGHMDRYDAHPHDTAWHLQHGGADNEYLANEHPLFATHEGRVHVIDGHNRVGAALRRGDSSITGYHVNLDEHEHLTEPNENWS